MAAPNLQKLFRVNLLVKKGEEPDVLSKLFKWTLSSGRFIVIVVELIVIGAFIYRYKLDADLAGIQEKIKQQVPYLESLKTDEAVIRQVQFQLSSIKQVRNENPNFQEIFEKIAILTPKSIRLTNLAVDQSSDLKASFSITGQTPSNLEVSAFMKALRQEPLFTDVTLTNISFEGETTFSINGSLKSEGKVQ